MIVSKTPLRVSFFGGGSDVQGFYSRHPGVVLSAAINKYVYVAVHELFEGYFRISYSRTENVSEVTKIEHPLVREVLMHLKQDKGLEIGSFADIPSYGSGLGSSSAFTIGLINAVNNYGNQSNLKIDKLELARMSAFIEIERCKEPIGKQDQYSCALGGLNRIDFHSDESVTFEKINNSISVNNFIAQNFILVFTGLTRKASKMLSDQNSDLHFNDTKQRYISQLTQFVPEAIQFIRQTDAHSFGKILDESWKLKKMLNIESSNKVIDDLYDLGLKSGAVGGKLLGAGGGGFILFCVPEDLMSYFKSKMKKFKSVNFEIDDTGPSVFKLGD